MNRHKSDDYNHEQYYETEYVRNLIDGKYVEIEQDGEQVVLDSSKKSQVHLSPYTEPDSEGSKKIPGNKVTKANLFSAK